MKQFEQLLTEPGLCVFYEFAFKGLKIAAKQK